MTLSISEIDEICSLNAEFDTAMKRIETFINIVLADPEYEKEVVTFTTTVSALFQNLDERLRRLERRQ